LQREPHIPSDYGRNSVWRNALRLLKMFMVKPVADVAIRLLVDGHTEVIHTRTESDGFFKADISLEKPLGPGWHGVTAHCNYKGVESSGSGKVFIPFETQYVFVSDIDDTFLVSHSRRLLQRLYLLLTKNAHSRKSFADASRHYQLLAQAHTPSGMPNPFFYVSSSEWNLYEFIKEFSRKQQMPEGVFLLSQIKSLRQVLSSGQNNHDGKYMRIARVMLSFPGQQFVLLGDDTQKDPEIYATLVRNFPGRIKAVYLRAVRKVPRASNQARIDEIAASGVEVCYFKHSSEAIAHSSGIGLA
jgi:phosphatidate phosphatase APP1